MLKKKRIPANTVVLFIMICVYYCLNVRGLSLSVFTVARWICPVLLLGIAILNKDGRIIAPPALVLCFSIAVLLPALFGAAPMTSLIKYCSWVLIFYGSYIYFYQLSDQEAMHRCFEMLAVVLVIFQVLNFVFVVLRVDVVNDRSTGITTNANTLGVYSNLAFWAGSYWCGRENNRQNRLGWYAFMATSVYTVIASGSRIAFVVLMANILIYFLVVKKKRGMFLLASILLGLFVALLLAGKLAFLNISAIDRLAAEGGTDRGYLWDMAISLWKENKLFGVGYTISARFNEIDGLGFHNSYLSFLVECGLWGVAFFLPVLVMELIRIMRFLKKSVAYSASGEFPCAFAMLLVLIIVGWSESFMFAVGSTEGFTFWFLLAWLISYTKSQKEKKAVTQ